MALAPDDATAYRWLKVEHPDLDFWGIKGPLPWPAGKKEKIERTADFAFAPLLEGIRRLRAAGREWKDEWGAIEAFLDRGEELGDALELSDFPTVLRILDELETLRPGTAYCAFNRAFALRSLGDRPGALASAIRATELAPKLEYLWMRRGDLHGDEEQPKDAIFCYRKALALLPGHAQALEGLCRFGAMKRLRLNYPDGTHRDHYYNREEFAEMLRENIARLSPEDPQLRFLLPQFRESPDGANEVLLVLDRLLSGQPADARLLRAYRADALRLLKRTAEAHQLLEELLAEDPRFAEAYYVRAWCEYDQGEVELGDALIALVLALDPNHQKALQVHFRLSSHQGEKEVIDRLSDWGREHGSWRAHWLGSTHASDLGDNAIALRCAEAAYRLAPQERDALFLYANCLNNMQEGEHTAALIHPRLPEVKGDFVLLYIFAGAMKKLGLPEEAIRVLREILADEERELRVEWRGWAQHFLDELTGFVAASEIDLEFHPGSDTLRREIWVGTDEGPKMPLLPSGVSVPTGRGVHMERAPGFTGSTGSLAVFMHGHNAEREPISLGWFRAHEIDFDAEKPLMTIEVTEKKKLEASARQGTRRLPVTWSLYRVASMETEGLEPPGR